MLTALKVNKVVNIKENVLNVNNNQHFFRFLFVNIKVNLKILTTIFTVLTRLRKETFYLIVNSGLMRKFGIK